MLQSGDILVYKNCLKIKVEELAIEETCLPWLRNVQKENTEDKEDYFCGQWVLRISHDLNRKVYAL